MIDHEQDALIQQALHAATGAAAPTPGAPSPGAPVPGAGPQQAAQLIRPAAEAGDTRAEGLLAYWLTQQGQQPEAVDWAERAAEGEFLFVAWWVGQQLVNQPDVALRTRGVALFSKGSAAASGIDPISLAQQLAQQGSPDLGVQLLTSVVGSPTPWRQQGEAALKDVQQRVNAIAQLQESLEAQRDETADALRAMKGSAESELESLQRLGGEVGDIAHNRAADYLKEGYEAEANRVERRANVMTILSVLLAIGIATAAIIIATHLPSGDTLHQALEKAAFSIPLLALNAYLGRLASVYREEALRWRHIKLQIQTANPFLVS